MAAAESADAMAVRAASICAVMGGTHGLNCSLRFLRVQALVRSSSAELLGDGNDTFRPKGMGKSQL